MANPYPGPLPDDPEDEDYLPVRPANAMANLDSMSGVAPVNTGAPLIRSAGATAAPQAPSMPDSDYPPVSIPRGSSGPNLSNDIMSGNVAPPVYTEPKVSTGRAIGGGLLSLISPQLGQRVMEAPVERAQRQYAADKGQYDTAVSQGSAQQKNQSEQNLQGAQANEANARADALKNPQQKPTKPTKGALVFDKAGNAVGYQNEDGDLMAPDNPKLPPDVAKILASAKPKPEPAPEMKASTLQLPNGQKVAGKIDHEGNLLLSDGTAAPKGALIYQQPNYGQLVLPTKTQTVLDENGIPTIMGWDEKTQKFDIPQGASASGSYGHEEAQAGAVERSGQQLITELHDPVNRQLLGQLSSYVKQGTLGTPLADARAARLSAELKTFAALQPAMHGFRSRSAQEAFEKIIGGLAQDPDATIGSIQGILKTAGNVRGQQPSEEKGPDVGTTRTINGQKARWDGKGWLATK